ncbi:MAG TPA: hypothetical protein VL357_06400 [Rariglobus sp.]|jgi:hypothetical protein|nr:hypothetical protein [Rariglobus sp.]
MKNPTVCLFYGFSRNLTTLFASLFSLHPKCQVLNHSSKVILAEKDNFLAVRTPKSLEKFIQSAIKNSSKNIKGVGGSIVSSHAFTTSFSSEEISTRYQARFGTETMKNEIESLVWKDAAHMTDFLEDNGISALEVAAAYPEVRFILPIRNLVDCILSNVTKHKGRWGNHTIEEIAEIIIRRTRDFLEMEKKCPAQFMHFFQDEVDAKTVARLGEFMGLEASPQWNQDFLDCYILKPSDGTSAEFKKTYSNLVRQYLSGSPEAAKFLSFAEQIPTVPASV